jgi:hypothetical protein
VDVVLPTPPFWLAMVMTRILIGGVQHPRGAEGLHRDRTVEVGHTAGGRGGRLVGSEAAPQPFARVGHRGSFLPIRFTWNAVGWLYLFHVEQRSGTEREGAVTVLHAS